MDENSNEKTTPQEPVPAQAGDSIAPATPLPAAAVPEAKSTGVRTVVLAGASAVVGAALVLGGVAVGYSIGNNDSDNYREATMAVSGDRNSEQGESYGDSYEERKGNGPMMGHDDEYGMRGDEGPMGGSRDGGMMQGPGDMNDEYGMRGGEGPMMQGNGIQDFLDQLQGGQGLSPDQQQFLDQLKGFVGGMRNQMG